MHRHIRKQLEGRLSADVLEFLNEEFHKMEEIIIKLKETEKREQMLTEELCKKDKMLWSLFDKSVNSSLKQPIGYHNYSQDYFNNPEEDYKKKMNTPIFDMRMARGTGGRYTSSTPTNTGTNSYNPYTMPYFENDSEQEARYGK